MPLTLLIARQEWIVGVVLGHRVFHSTAGDGFDVRLDGEFTSDTVKPQILAATSIPPVPRVGRGQGHNRLLALVVDEAEFFLDVASHVERELHFGVGRLPVAEECRIDHVAPHRQRDLEPVQELDRDLSRRPISRNALVPPIRSDQPPEPPLTCLSFEKRILG